MAKLKRSKSAYTNNQSATPFTNTTLTLAVLLLIVFGVIYQRKQSSQLLTTNVQNSILGDSDEREDGEEEKHDQEVKEEEDKKEAEQQAEQDKQEAENEQQESPKSPTLAPEFINVKTQSEGDKSETEIETLDGQKIKTKVEDDGTTKVEIEHNKLKVRYEIRNGQMTSRAEDEDGNEVDLSESEQESLEDEVENELEQDGIKISTDEGGLIKFAKNRISATTHFPLSIDVGTNQLVITTPAGQKVVAVLPDQAVQNLLTTGVISVFNGNLPTDTKDTTTVEGVSFTLENNEPVYEVDGLKTYKLFAFIPVSQPIKAIVSAQTGDILRVKKSFFTNVIDLLSPQ